MTSTQLRRLALLTVIGFILVSFFNNPPNGRTGAPGDGLCSDCHSGGGSQDGNVEISGLPPMIEPGFTYQITLTSNNPNGMATFAGFQLVSLNSSNDNAGSMNNASSGSTVTPSGGRTYWEHNPAQSFGASNAVSWTVDWTAPSGPGGEEITMYAASNVANGNGSSSGDLIVTTNVSGTLEDTGPPLAVDIISSSDVSCTGDSDGMAMAEASGGIMPYQYEWSNGEMGPSAIMLEAGLVSVTVTDDGGSTASASITILEPPLLQLALSDSEDISCNGAMDGSATVNAIGGTPGYSYEWSDGQSGQSASNLSAGIIMVTVTDNNSCESSIQITINEPAALGLVISDQADVSCFGVSDGSVTVQGLGGTSPYNYSWDDGQSGSTAINLPGGIIGVTVTDANQCEFSDIVNIGEPQVLQLNVVSTSNVSCAGQNDGSATVEATGGVTPYSFLWSDGSTEPENDQLTAGNYAVTVTDANDCTAEISINIIEPNSLEVSPASILEPSCNGSDDGSVTVMVIGGTSPYILDWSDGSSDTMITDLTAGTYSLTVTDVQGCQDTTEYILVEPDPLELNLSTSDESSSGAEDGTANVDPVGGTPPYSVEWSTGMTSDTIEGLAPGAYSVTVTDANMCEKVTDFTINTFGCSLDVVASISDPDCFDGSNGSVELTITGANGMHTTEWSTGANSDTLNGLMAGVYSVTIVDEADCVESIDVTVQQPEQLLLTTNSTDESAPGASDGSASVDAVGGVEPYDYQWNTGDTTSSINGLSPDTYTVTVTDMNGCVDSAILVVNQADCQLELDTLMSHVSCFNVTDGSICPLVSGGSLPYLFSWSDGSMDSCLSNVGSGTYSLTVTDNDGCQVSGDFTINEPDSIIVSSSVMHVTCADDSDGSIQLAISGGTPPYEVDWSDSQSGTGINGLEGGDYSFTLTDMNGCPVEGSEEVEEPDPLVAEVDSVVNSEPGMDNGAIFIEVSGGTSPFEVKWFDSDGLEVSSNEDLENVGEGLYSVEVSDVNGCLFSMDSIRVSTITSSTDPENVKSIGLFPNPAKSPLTLSIELQEATSLKYDLMNNYGQVVRLTKLSGKSTIWNVQIPVQDLDAGVYFLRCYVKGGMVVRSFVKI